MTSSALENIAKVILVSLVIVVIFGIFYFGLFPEAKDNFLSKVTEYISLGKQRVDVSDGLSISESLTYNANFIATKINEMKSDSSLQEKKLVSISLKEINPENNLIISSVKEDGKDYLRIIIDEGGYKKYIDYTPSKRDPSKREDKAEDVQPNQNQKLNYVVEYKPCVADFYSITKYMYMPFYSYKDYKYLQKNNEIKAIFLTSVRDIWWNIVFFKLKLLDDEEIEVLKKNGNSEYRNFIGLVKIDGDICFIRELTQDECKLLYPKDESKCK